MSTSSRLKESKFFHTIREKKSEILRWLLSGSLAFTFLVGCKDIPTPDPNGTATPVATEAPPTSTPEPTATVETTQVEDFDALDDFPTNYFPIMNCNIVSGTISLGDSNYPGNLTISVLVGNDIALETLWLYNGPGTRAYELEDPELPLNDQALTRYFAQRSLTYKQANCRVVIVENPNNPDIKTRMYFVGYEAVAIDENGNEITEVLWNQPVS